jgi:hypothetical protein
VMMTRCAAALASSEDQRCRLVSREHCGHVVQ